MNRRSSFRVDELFVDQFRVTGWQCFCGADGGRDRVEYFIVSAMYLQWNSECNPSVSPRSVDSRNRLWTIIEPFDCRFDSLPGSRYSYLDWVWAQS